MPLILSSNLMATFSFLSILIFYSIFVSFIQLLQCYHRWKCAVFLFSLCVITYIIKNNLALPFLWKCQPKRLYSYRKPHHYLSVACMCTRWMYCCFCKMDKELKNKAQSKYSQKRLLLFFSHLLFCTIIFIQSALSFLNWFSFLFLVSVYLYTKGVGWGWGRKTGEREGANSNPITLICQAWR